MNVLDHARSIGLVADQVTGTIDEDTVLLALARLAQSDPDNDELYRNAAARVRQSRSAGTESAGDGQTVRLRYRSEMADVFVDLAIDVGMRTEARFAAVVG